MAPTMAPCISQTQLCSSCVQKRGCWDCGRWECADCKADTFTVAQFMVYWEEHDPDVTEDVYGRGRCPQHALDLKRCCGCKQKFCSFCSEACAHEKCENVLCHKFCCRRAEFRMKTTGCQKCQYAIDMAIDYETGPVDWSKVCRSCFYAYPQECGCGQPSWDSEMEISHNENGSDED